MIKNIRVKAKFLESKTDINLSFSPQPGITAVVGPNGSGKSFVVMEVTRWLLFGKKALRGEAKDYKNTEATGIFEIKGSTYVVSRGGKIESVKDDKGTLLAFGPEATTAKCVELLGYGMKVFDICNASVQKQGDIFGKMKPSERKRMMDEVLGLTSNEQVEKACRDESKVLKRESDALQQTLVVPIEPVKPEGYVNSEVLEKELNDVRAYRTRYQAIQQRVHILKPPTEPQGQRTSLGDVEAHEQKRMALENQRNQLLSTLGGQTAEPRYSLDDLEIAITRGKLLPRPVLSIDEINEAEKAWADHDLAHKLAGVELECPNCAHNFNPSSVVPDTAKLVSKDLLRTERSAHDRWANAPEGLDLDSSTITNEIAAHKAAEIRSRLEQLELLEDRSAERELALQWLVYDENLQAYEAESEARAELEAMQEPVSEQEILELNRALMEARNYEKAVVDHLALLENYRTLTEKIGEKLRLSEEYVKGAEALNDTRLSVKAYLAPKLSEVASSLIRDMTHGDFQNILVDEDMNITVNGQRLETLSGGGETVANIALRIALGQVLVADTFPVFLADEIDADADDVRREAVANALSSLKDKLQQIILVTHRSVDVAEHVWDLALEKEPSDGKSELHSAGLSV